MIANKKKNIAIIGSGFSALSCCAALNENNIVPTIIDLKKRTEKKKYKLSDLILPFSKKFKININFIVGFGGLSKVWQGIVSPFTKNEILEIYPSKIKFKNDIKFLKNFFNFRILNVYEKKNFSNKVRLFDLKENNKLSDLCNEKKINFPKIICNKNNYNPLSLDKKISELHKKKKIKIINDEVLNLRITNDYVEITLNNEGSFKVVKFDHVFVSAGIQSTYNLTNKFFDKRNLRLKTSKKFLILIKFNQQIQLTNKTKNYPFMQISYDKDIIYNIQIYTLYQLLLRLLPKKISQILLNLNILKFGVGYLSVHSKYSPSYDFVNDKIINEHKIKKKLYKSFKNINYLNKKKILILKVYNFAFQLGFLSGNHFGAFLPMKYKENKSFAFKTKKKISIIGLSSLTYFSGKPPTLRMILNTYNSTKKIIKSIIYKNH